jgi:hypothetical protein
MPANELPGTIGDVRGSRNDWFVREMPLEVGRQLGRRRITPRAILLHGLERDPIEIATHFTHQGR